MFIIPQTVTRLLSRGEESSAEEMGVSSTPCQQVYLHPCTINGQPHVVYPRGLKQTSPGLFERLRAYYEAKGYALKEDQRSEESRGRFRGRERRKVVPALVFTASMLFESAAHAEVEVDLTLPQPVVAQSVPVQIVPNNAVRDEIKRQMDSAKRQSRPTRLEPGIARDIFEQLKAHYVRADSDPDFILEDFRQIANYYSDYPEVTELLESLAGEDWELRYSEEDWTTTASGSIFEVEKAVIYFNTRYAAQLRLNNGCKGNPVCVASPADALLHELLHAHGMLVETEKFIAQGGMNSVTYPYKHEYAVIASERRLYNSMTQEDARKRPRRHAHTGRTVKARCPTCIE